MARSVQCPVDMRLPITVGLLVSVLSVPALAEAQERRYYRYDRDDRDSDDDYYGREYRRGLFARVNAGAGGLAADDDLNDATLSGGAGLLSVDLGGSLQPNLALHGRLSINSVFEPNLSSSDGEDFGELDDTSLRFTLIGGGLTYYLPSNLYLTGVLGLSRAAFELDGVEYDTLNGVGFSGDIGYEWPLGDSWGLDLGGRVELHNVRGDGEQLSTASIGVLLGVTYF
jgi:hypothetical protein